MHHHLPIYNNLDEYLSNTIKSAGRNESTYLHTAQPTEIYAAIAAFDLVAAAFFANKDAAARALFGMQCFVGKCYIDTV